ncbi:methyltransferase domain-containing protein [Streptomyces sp. 3MP-14]|uniref:Methyltransferase domain-containing protein n=1 Tax=Streptomyces mimosae TaxID=2586635 RepID=A0A5N6ACI8_9ACTN|nr:methyltransferase domain-containing protein [Streptomyces mimosae]KAB8175860.1 methyltransferase domain-containing protein [Streptomyces sp. 3MP-14]
MRQWVALGRREGATVTQYDTLAARLADIEKAIGFLRENVEFPSFLRALGSPRGMRVLDVGCGDGHYARMVAELGADQVVGTDSSAEMIRLARAAEEDRPLGVGYLVHDVATMPELGPFDLVIAVNVLHYADSWTTLAAMCRRIGSQLAPGGRLLAYVGNARCEPEVVRDFGFLVDRPPNLREGDPYTITIPVTPPASLRVHHWLPETLERAVESAGFTRITWEEMVCSDTSGNMDTRMERLLESPPSLLLSAYRE